MLRRFMSLCLVACLLAGFGTMCVFATETQPAETEPSATEAVTEPEETAPAETVPEETTPEVPAEEVLRASDDAIAILKLEEGFSTYPYWDYSQWTVGYGTECPADKLDDTEIYSFVYN